MAATNSFPSFTLGDVNTMPRRPVVSSDVLDTMRFVEVTGVTSTLPSREIGRMLAGVIEWRYMDGVLRTDIVALMPNAAIARESAARVNAQTNYKATVSDRWPAVSASIGDKLSHMKELRSDEDPASAVLYYALPKDSVVESQRRLGVAFAAKNETVGVTGTRWVDSRDAY